jgi:Uncharacterized conserved protein
MAAYDFKKEYKDLYLPKPVPAIIQVPKMLFIAVDGAGDPNTSKSYAEALEILYGLCYSIKMSKLSGNTPQGYFDYVMPPLEGFWSLPNYVFDGQPIQNKDAFVWTSLIRQPDFVTEAVFQSAKETLKKKKPDLDTGKAQLFTFEEGLCAQIMHLGPYDEEPATIAKLNAFIEASGHKPDFNDIRRHHEIYLGNPRKTAPENLKTVIRHPIA